MNGTSLSPAGSALFGDPSINSANDESEEQRKRRLAAIAQSQSRLGAGSNFSSAGQALLGYGGLGAGM